LTSARYRFAALKRKPPTRAERAVARAVSTRYQARLPGIEAPFYVSPEDREAPAGVPSRSGMLSLAYWFMFGNELEGDYLEFGSFQGRTFRLAWEHHRRHFDGRVHFWLFDSFRGLPESTGGDTDPKWQAGRLAYSVDELHEVATGIGASRTAYTPVEGFFADTLTPERASQMAADGVRAGIVYVDCDLYDSAKLVLDFARPMLQTGTVLCFDDFYCFAADPDKGEQRALREFLVANPGVGVVEYYRYGWHGRSFIVHLLEA
jgi:hypothetical protein